MSGNHDIRPTCFVVMAFGRKTDYATGRSLDLDRSYKNLIKPAVEAAGLTCVRADEMVHAGGIIGPVFDQLASANLVIADLSTSSGEVYYELGMRHALRPHGTIVIAEDQLKMPFDMAHTAVLKYQHLGPDISYDEVLRFRQTLKEAITRAMEPAGTDSPVYNFLPNLRPAFLDVPSMTELSGEPEAPITSPAQTVTGTDITLAELLEQAEHAFKAKDFETALKLFDSASTVYPNNQTITQRRVLVISKSQRPDPVSALSEARRLLESLSPRTSADPEIVMLLGDIELAMFEAGLGVHHLLNARQAFDRSYANKPDWRRGGTLAYLVIQQAARQKDPDERKADFVIARRLWRDVLELGKNRLVEIDAIRQVEHFLPEAPDPAERELEEAQILCAVAEAYFGLGRFEKYENERSRIAWGRNGAEMVKKLESRVQMLGLLTQTQTGIHGAASEDGSTGEAATMGGRRPASARRFESRRDYIAASGLTDYSSIEPTPETGKQIFISYAWGDESEAVADQLDRAFQSRSISIVRDKRDLKFKGRIKSFMDQIGRGKCVILVISKKYLESPNCWYELLRVAEHGEFYERVFPVVLPSAGIFEPVERLRYVQYWEQKQRELDEALKSVSAANLHGFREEIDLYTEVRERLPKLTEILKDMNTLTTAIHHQPNFEELYEAVMEKLSS